MMRYLLFFIFTLLFSNLSTNCLSQTSTPSLKNTFTLNGQVTGKETGRMILNYQDSTNNWLSDTTCLKNGKFTFKGFIDQPTLASLGDPKYVNGGSINTVLLFIEPTEMTVQLKEGDYDNADLKGSDVQEEYKLFLKEKNKVNEKWKGVTEVFEKLNYSNETDSIKRKIVNEKRDRLRPKIKQKEKEIEELEYGILRWK